VPASGRLKNENSKAPSLETERSHSQASAFASTLEAVSALMISSPSLFHFSSPKCYYSACARKLYTAGPSFLGLLHPFHLNNAHTHTHNSDAGVPRASPLLESESLSIRPKAIQLLSCCSRFPFPFACSLLTLSHTFFVFLLQFVYPKTNSLVVTFLFGHITKYVPQYPPKGA